VSSPPQADRLKIENWRLEIENWKLQIPPTPARATDLQRTDGGTEKIRNQRPLSETDGAHRRAERANACGVDGTDGDVVAPAGS